MRWRFRSRLKSSQHLAAARIHNPGGRFQASCCIRAFGQLLPVVVSAPKQTLAYLDFSIAAVRR